MARQKLNIRFHDPNPVAEAAGYIAQIFIQANRLRFERLIEAYAASADADKAEDSGH